MRVPVQSATISSIGYNTKTQELDVAFTNGDVYRYFAVPASVHKALTTASNVGNSVGKLFHVAVKKRFEFVKLDEDPEALSGAPAREEAQPSTFRVRDVKPLVLRVGRTVKSQS